MQFPTVLAKLKGCVLEGVVITRVDKNLNKKSCFRKTQDVIRGLSNLSAVKRSRWRQARM